VTLRLAGVELDVDGALEEGGDGEPRDAAGSGAHLLEHVRGVLDIDERDNLRELGLDLGLELHDVLEAGEAQRALAAPLLLVALRQAERVHALELQRGDDRREDVRRRGLRVLGHHVAHLLDGLALADRVALLLIEGVERRARGDDRGRHDGDRVHVQ
jgi:hypothetical protein